MTSDPAQPVPKPETFRSHLPAIAAAAGTVLAVVLGSLIGAAGTVAGMAIGSVMSGTCSWWAERGIRRSAAIAAARAGAIRARGRPLRSAATARSSRSCSGVSPFPGLAGGGRAPGQAGAAAHPARPGAGQSRIAARLCAAGAAVARPAGRIGLQGGCRQRVECADGPGEGEDLAVHQALVELVQVEQLRLLRVPGLQQVGGRGAQRDGAEPGRVQR